MSKEETTFAEEAQAKEAVERAKTEQRISEQIKDVLDLSGYALQPFLSFSEYGVVPRVRLVPNPDANETGTDNTEGGEDTASDEPTESSES